ncbi:MAG: PilZ domain-containing protein [Pseudomonadota bacterium]|nr:PilZ domain-containing protein [Pseudomonadota bacterium]
MNSVTLPALKPSERRGVQRLPADNINVLVKSLRSRPNSVEFGEVESVDFNRKGVGFISPQCFNIGDEVDLLIQSNAGIAEVRGVVCNRARSEQNYRCGVAFCGTSDAASKALRQFEAFQQQEQLTLFN